MPMIEGASVAMAAADLAALLARAVSGDGAQHTATVLTSPGAAVLCAVAAARRVLRACARGATCSVQRPQHHDPAASGEPTGVASE